MNDMAIKAAIALLGLSFGAGGYAFAFRRATRDLNGLGRKYHRLVALLNRWADTDEKRKQVSDLIEGK